MRREEQLKNYIKIERRKYNNQITLLQLENNINIFDKIKEVKENQDTKKINISNNEKSRCVKNTRRCVKNAHLTIYNKILKENVKSVESSNYTDEKATDKANMIDSELKEKESFLKSNQKSNYESEKASELTSILSQLIKAELYDINKLIKYIKNKIENRHITNIKKYIEKILNEIDLKIYRKDYEKLRLEKVYKTIKENDFHTNYTEYENNLIDKIIAETKLKLRAI